MRLGKKACVFVALLALSACAPVCPQPNVGWTSYTDAPGVWDMAFGTDGNLWIVHGGFDESGYFYEPGEEVSKWDVSRENATRYTSADGLVEGQVWSVAAGPDGVMWFGATDGVSYFDGERWGAYTTAHGLPEGDVVSITVAPDGEVWAGTRWAGVSRFDGEAWALYAAADDSISDTFWSFAIAPDGTVCGGSGDVVSCFDGMTWATYVLPDDYYSHGFSITDIVGTSDGLVWVATDGKGVFQFDDGAWFRYGWHEGLASPAVTSIAIAPDGALWFGTERGGVSRFDGETWTTYTTADGLISDHVTAIAVAPDGALWFGTDVGLSRYQPPGGGLSEEQQTTTPVPTLLRPTPVVPEGARTRSKLGIAHAIAYSPDGQSLVLGLPNGVSLHRAELSEQIWSKESDPSLTSSVAFSPDGATLASGTTRIFGSPGDNIILWDTATGERVRTLTGHTTNPVIGVTFSPDETMLASVSWDGTIILWDTMTWERVRTFKVPGMALLRVAFSPDGTTLAAASTEAPYIALWDTTTWEQVHTPIPSCFFAAYSPDGATMACASDDAITLRDTATGEPVHTLEGDVGSVSSVAFSPDGALLAAGEYGTGTIILWDTATGQRVRTLEGHADTVFDLAFSPDGKTLASVSQDGTVILWDVAR